MQLDGGGDARCGQGSGEEADVGLLVVVDLLQVGVVGVGEAGGDELFLRVVGEALLVELAL